MQSVRSKVNTLYEYYSCVYFHLFKLALTNVYCEPFDKFRDGVIFFFFFSVRLETKYSTVKFIAFAMVLSKLQLWTILNYFT